MPSYPAQTHTQLAVDQGGWGGGKVEEEKGSVLSTQACVLHSAEHAEGIILHYQP